MVKRFYCVKCRKYPKDEDVWERKECFIPGNVYFHYGCGWNVKIVNE